MRNAFSPGRMILGLFLAVTVLVQSLPAALAAGDETELIGGKDSGMINILLIGRDGRDTDIQRSDSIILCSFRPDTRQITFVSFLRDLYVPIPGHAANRLNAAYALGGADLLKQTLEETFCLHTDGCIEADFSQFSGIIDLLGGVILDLRQDEAEAVEKAAGGPLKAGVNLLNGAQALAYSRLRKLDSDGDFSRTNRQRKVLSSLLERYRSADLLTVLSLTADILPLIRTDLEKRQVIALGAKLFPFLKDPAVTSLSIPAAGSYEYQKIRGMEVLKTESADLRSQLRNALTIPDENLS